MNSIKPFAPLQGLIFDIDGVLEYQGRIYPGAVETIKRLKQKNIAVRFLTNSTLKSRASCAQKLRTSGFAAEDHEVITASFATACWLREQKPRSIWVFLEREGLSEFKEFVQDEQNPEYVVIGDNRARFDFDHLNRALRLISRGAKLVGMIDELIDSSLGDLELNVGSWVRMLETAAGVQATYIGKPSFYAFEMTLKTMKAPKESVIMVGDRVLSDILGAQRAGLRSVLVKTGEFRKEELNDSIRPDYSIDSIALLLEALQIG
ncbi:MAG: HAD-IIA family hydrolase [Desulfobacteraceae bacterium]|nr:MAG: HAD-IIA family hydrolase [Desulfobacteraceae bacterium]